MSFDPWSRVGLNAAVRFTVLADADAGLLPRLLQPCARRDLTPDAMESVRTGDLLRVTLSFDAMPAEAVGLVEGNLRQVVGVRDVSRRQEITGMVVRRAA